MTTTAFDTKTVNGLMAMFYDGASKRNAVQTFERGESQIEQITLTAKQFAWLCDVERREYGTTPRGRAGREVTGELVGVGFFTAHERKYGSAIVNIRVK
jgi:hypothetical protein